MSAFVESRNTSSSRRGVFDVCRCAALLLLCCPFPVIAQQDGDRLLSQPFVRMVGGLLRYELKPDANSFHQGAPFHTNRWGMHDRDYSLQPPPNTYRIALLGTSLSMGAGVSEQSTHEALIEARLNRDGPGVPKRHYEILNFAVAGYGILNDVVVVQTKVFRFSPDAVVLVIHNGDRFRASQQLAAFARNGDWAEYPYLQQKFLQRKVTPDMDELAIRQRLFPVLNDVIQWAFGQIADACRRNGVPLVVVAFPIPTDSDNQKLELLSRIATTAGITVVSVDGAYEGYDPATLTLRINGKPDPHLNELGHQVMAKRMYAALFTGSPPALDLTRSHTR